jgi:molecular chaperone HtpG
VRRYSDFVEHPIEMAAVHFPDAPAERKSTSEEGLEVVRLNSMKPLWARPRESITAEEHREFYRHLTHQWDEPLETVHLEVEGAAAWTALLYLPSERPVDLFEPERQRSRLALYVKRIFIMADCEELLPPWLRFVSGLVDAQDLPLNVSRETLQENRAVAKIRERLTKKLLDTLSALQAERRADYVRFWRACGPILKEGIVLEPDKAERVAALALFESSRGAELTTLDECVERMGAREELWVLAAPDRDKALALPHLEALQARGEEVLFLTDPVDEWVLQRLERYKEKRLVPIDRGQVDPGGALAKEAREELERAHRELFERLEGVLKPHVATVRFSARLKDSAAVLVDEGQGPGPYMERMLRQAGRPVPERKRALELNSEHAAVKRLAELFEAEPGSPRVAEFAELLLAQAHVAEGSPLPDPKRFAELVNRLWIDAR